MSLQVIHHDHGNVQGKGQGLGEGGAHQERAQQAGAAGECDGREVFGLDAGPFQGFRDHRYDVLFMRTGCQFRHHAAKVFMHLLRCDHVGQQDAVADYGRRCVVAGGFDSEYDICHVCL